MKAALLYHLYSGHLFFSAAAMFVVALTVDLVTRSSGSRWLRSTLRVTTLLAIVLAAFSATPLPLIIAIPILAATIAHTFAPETLTAKLRHFFRILALAAALTACVLEVPYHLRRPPIPRPTRLYVIGDSLAAGGFGEKEPWPNTLAGRLKAELTNLALPAETSAMAVRNQLPRLPSAATGNECVIVEIGGNDMFERRPAGEFSASLDAILTAASSGGRRPVILLEIPLLPGRWHYGAVQRKLARKYGAALVPRRVLARVLVDPQATSDGLHLTQTGHERLASALMNWLGWP